MVYPQSSTPRRRNYLPFIVAGVLAIALIVGLRMFTGGGDDDKKDDGKGTAQNQPTSRCSGKDRLELSIAASPDKSGLLAKIAEGYNGKKVAGRCVDVTISNPASGDAMQRLAEGWKTSTYGPEPDVWIPASKGWVTLLRHRLGSTERAGSVPDDTPSIANSPLVIAMPRPMAEALGWPKKQLGWADLLELSKTGWGKYGHPEWGNFRWGKTNPNFSTSGLNATVGAYFAATGRTGDLSEKNVDDPKVQKFVQDIERSVVHYGDTTLTFLSNLQMADDQGRGLSYISAVAVEEKSVWDYNQGNPTGDPKTLGKHAKPKYPLVALYPSEGTLFSDHPYVVLARDATKQKAAADFLKFVQSPQSQKKFLDFAFRDKDGKAGPLTSEANGMDPAEPKTTLSTPIPNVFDKALKKWSVLRKPANVLLVMDTSGSMAEPVEGSGKTRLELAKEAAIRALPQFGTNDKVGLWMFSTQLDGSKDYLELEPIAPIGKNKQAIQQHIEGLPPEGGTGLYDSVLASYQHVAAHSDPQAINAVVFMTDGKNEDDNGITIDKLTQELDSEAGGVRVFTIGYGESADLDVLRKISTATHAKAYDASDPATINKVFTEVISNF